MRCRRSDFKLLPFRKPVLMLQQAGLTRCIRTAAYFRRFASVTSNTIFAVATGSSKAAIAVIRVSGDGTSNVLRSIISSGKLPEPRRATYTKLLHPQDGTLLDKCIVLWFPKPNSVTGEDYCELHIHGGVAVQSAVLSALRASSQSMRLAEPGEFAKRSYLNGKMDLTEVEGLADLINAETEKQRRQAVRQLDGELSKLYSSWRDELSTCLANLEAYIDFADEEQIDADVLERVHRGASRLRVAIRAHLDDARRGERLRSGVKLVIVGAPNGGKSSLLNLLAQRNAAIVSPVAGTTRDVIEVSFNLGGYPVQLVDTAGLRRRPVEGGDTQTLELEEEGMRRTYLNWRIADLLFVVIDTCEFQSRSLTGASLTALLDAHTRNLLDMQIDLQAETGSNVAEYANLRKVFLLNKSDLLSDVQKQSLGKAVRECNDSDSQTAVLLLSCVTRDGFEALLSQLQRSLVSLCGSGEPHEPPYLTQTRHRILLRDCLASLDAFLSILLAHEAEAALADGHVYADHAYVEGAEHLRRALRHLGKVTGHVSTEELLSVIFRQFCIGK